MFIIQKTISVILKPVQYFDPSVHNEWLNWIPYITYFLKTLAFLFSFHYYYKKPSIQSCTYFINISKKNFPLLQSIYCNCIFYFVVFFYQSTSIYSFENLIFHIFFLMAPASHQSYNYMRNNSVFAHEN